MVVKNMDIWAISGNNNIEATQYSNSNQVIIRNLKLQKIDSSCVKNYKKEYSLHLNTSIFDKTKCNDEYK